MANRILSETASSYFMNVVVRKRRHAAVPWQIYKSEELSKQWNLFSYNIMRRDKVKMSAYSHAIKQYVKGKTVLEIGTGPFAPLAVECAHAGAKTVYALEANSKSAELARKNIRNLGLDSTIRIIEGFSYNIELPEKPEVFVHELFGSIGSDEGMVRTLYDAKKRLLKENSVSIPHASAVRVAPGLYTPKRNPVLFETFRNMLWKFPEDCRQFHVWNFPKSQMFAPSQEYESRTYGADFSLEDSRRLEFRINKPVQFNGFVFWNRLSLTSSLHVDCFEKTHWGTAFLRCSDEPLWLQSGDRIILETYQNLENDPIYNFKTIVLRHEKELLLTNDIQL
jgi:hypothetical protein